MTTASAFPGRLGSDLPTDPRPVHEVLEAVMEYMKQSHMALMAEVNRTHTELVCEVERRHCAIIEQLAMVHKKILSSEVEVCSCTLGILCVVWWTQTP